MSFDPHHAQQAVDAFGTHGDATGIRLKMRAYQASSFVSVPFFVAPRRPPPKPGLPGHAPDRAVRTPSGRTTRSFLCRPATSPAAAALDRKLYPTVHKLAALPRSIP